jgi:branched-chain amino acid transport system permease protein
MADINDNAEHAESAESAENAAKAEGAERVEITETTEITEIIKIDEVTETTETVAVTETVEVTETAETAEAVQPFRLDHVPAQAGPARTAVSDSRTLSFIPASLAPLVALVGAVLSVGSVMLAWTGYAAFPGDLTVNGYPGGGQWYTLWTGILVALFALAQMRVPGLGWLAPRGADRALLPLTIGLVGTTWYTIVAIAAEAGGLANWNAGAWIAGLGSLIALLGVLALPAESRGARATVALPSWVEILAVALMLFAADEGISYVLNLDNDGSQNEVFIAFGLAIGFAAWGLVRGGLFSALGGMVQRNRSVSAVAILIAALLFPFTQQNESVVNVGDNILVFAGVALGLNIVVGLAGLLDLGYIAFLGCGAYAAALVSGATEAKAHWPFPLAMLLGIAVSVVAGVVIGAPTLRLRGDYLAIVTLGFGEIFRLAMNNLNGTTAPKVTNGPEGIFAIPNVNLFGWDLSRPETIGGHTFGTFSNYFFLLVLLIAVIVFVFARVNDSRIGRAWIAIREDETAATAMGINGFRFKMLAFGLGAALAGLAGTVQGHVTGTVTPDQYNFASTSPPNSTFLVAAVVLGGMGTIAGPLLGAALLYLIPFKLYPMVGQYQLLGFGLALILMMRFRPEGLIASRRRQLEFHEEEVAEAEAHAAVAGAGMAGA